MAHKMETTTSHAVMDSLFDEDIVIGGCADSGYASHASVSHTLSINASSLRSVSHLQPIPENIAVSSFLSPSELTPTSQNIQRINEFHITSPISSLKRSASSLSCTPTKIGTPKKRRLDGKSRSKAHRNLIDNIHVDENSENRDIVNVEFSPIKSMNVLHERNGKFERKGSFSSTPIYEDASMKSMSVSKTDFFNPTKRTDETSRVIRKTKSFSPSKKRWIVTRNPGISIEAVTIPEEVELTYNQERRPLKRMLCRQNAFEKQEEPSSSNFLDNLSSITSADLSDLDFKFESPVSHRSITPITTPVKKIRRNLSFNLSQPSPKKELDKIIFSKIPCSPPKQRIQATKRTSAVKTSSIAKRPLFDLSPLLPKRKSYAHLKHFDILSHLAETTTAIQVIFSHLSPKDIHSMYNVSHKWRTIVRNDAIAHNQHNKYLSGLMKRKENLQKKPLLKSRSLNAIPKSPLKRANSLNLRKNSLVVQPTQPSLNDPLVIMKENQCRTMCPLCGRHSIITKKSNDNSNILETHMPFQRSMDFDIETLRKSMRKTNPLAFAECTNKKCGYKFCIKCQFAYHDDEKCPTTRLVMPIQTDGGGGEKLLYPTGSRSKRNLRRLCSLDKIKFSSMD